MLVVTLVLLVLVIVASLISIPYYAITPGDAVDVTPLVGVPRSQSHPHNGNGAILLTDVQIVSLRAVNWLYYWLNSDDEIDRKANITGTLSTAQYDAQGVVDMSLAREAATIVGLKALGYGVRAVPNGAVDYGPEPNAPASSVLAIGDVITKVDATPTPSLAALYDALSIPPPGKRVTLTYRTVASTALRTGSVVLGEDRRAPAGAPYPVICAPLGANAKLAPYRVNGRLRGCLGIMVQQSYVTVGAPFAVNIQSEGIIGPSAGLAFSLGLIAKLDRKDLTGGLKVAATGTMSIDGSVGDVGGVAQKTVAVRDAGASIFFVPPQEYAVAKAHAGSHLKVVAVSSLAQALAELEALGGRLEPAATH